MKALTRTFALCLAVALAGCGGDELPRPEGFLLNIELQSISPDVISNINVNLVPQGTDERFMALPGPLTFDPDGQLNPDGPITYLVADDGALEIDVTGAHVRDRAVDNGDSSWTYTMQIWSAVLDCNPEGTECDAVTEGRMRNPAPLMTIVVDRGAQVLGSNQQFLTQWFLPLGGSLDIEVPCTDTTGLCTP